MLAVYACVLRYRKALLGIDTDCKCRTLCTTRLRIHILQVVQDFLWQYYSYTFSSFDTVK